MAALLASTLMSLRRRDTTQTLRRLIQRSAVWPEFAATDGLRATRRSARLLRANCLAQSIALTVAQHRAAKRPALILGCRRYDDGRWGAHAWVVVDSEVLDALPSGAHEPLAQLSADTLWVPTPIPPGRFGLRQ